MKLINIKKRKVENSTVEISCFIYANIFRAGGLTRYDTNLAAINARCHGNYDNLIIIQIIKVQVYG